MHKISTHFSIGVTTNLPFKGILL
uniref:Uncharacterized protein n=1 Tax=Rhizophora mucronata TaxID=61149 RepID=A0A2P2QCN1_RHIMU